MIMVLGSTAMAYASTGVVTEAKRIFISAGGSTWSFKVDDHTGIEMTGTCAEPHNGVIPRELHTKLKLRCFLLHPFLRFIIKQIILSSSKKSTSVSVRVVPTLL